MLKLLLVGVLKLSGGVGGGGKITSKCLQAQTCRTIEDTSVSNCEYRILVLKHFSVNLLDDEKMPTLYHEFWVFPPKDFTYQKIPFWISRFNRKKKKINKKNEELFESFLKAYAFSVTFFL